MQSSHQLVLMSRASALRFTSLHFTSLRFASLCFALLCFASLMRLQVIFTQQQIHFLRCRCMSGEGCSRT